MPDAIYSKSVQAGNIEDAKYTSSQIILPIFYNSPYGEQRDFPLRLPTYWSRDRDRVLRRTINAEALWSAALMISVTKMASMSWSVVSTSIRKTMHFQNMFINADGMSVGWVAFLAKHLQDYLLTDNGAFVEIVREKKGVGSRIVGVRHLDSLRCTRTRDPNYPVVYEDLNGNQHKLRDYQVIAISDLPDPAAEMNGVGHCAASRAYEQIFKMSSIERYISEKVSGLRPLSIYFLSGVLKRQVDTAIDSARASAMANDVAQFMGALIVPVPSDTTPTVVEIPLASLPDNFNRKEEFDIAILNYADNLGLDPQDLQPLTGTSLGTGAQSQVLDSKAKGKGLSAWRQQWQHMINNFVLDDKTKFAFSEEDLRDKAVESIVAKRRADISAVRINAGITTAAQELQVLVDQKELPSQFLDHDITPEETLSDTDKITYKDPPVQEIDRDEIQSEAEEKPFTKEKKTTEEIKELLVESLDEAVHIYERVKKNV